MQKKLRSVLLLIILFLSLQTQAQIVQSITGTVVDKQTNQPMSRVHILIKSKENNTIIAFTQSKENGSFVIKKNINTDVAYLELTHVGYTTEKIEIKGKTFPIKVELSATDVKLKEVVIVPQKIRAQGDTIIYTVSSFAAAQDRSMADVLKRMPGIKIEKSGEITYQGEKLNKFYIEGSDMLGGRYSLATNNISHQDVAAVEVMENHQPVKALEELVISTQPALNIRLKENAKSRWAGSVKAEGGVPSIWNAEALAMRFKKRSQTLNTYKGNNAGKGNKDFTMFSSIGDFAFMGANEPASYINVNPTSTGNIEANRYRFNQENNVSTNNLFKLNSDFDLITEVILSRDKQTSENTSQTNIFLGQDSIIREVKMEDARMVTKQLEGKLQLKGNKRKYYLKNELTFNLNDKETGIRTTGTYPNTQYADIDHRKIANDFNVLWRFGKKTINIRSYNEYAKKPQSLTVKKEADQNIRQVIDLSSFTSNTSADYSFSLGGKFRMSMEGRVSFEDRKMTNTLEAQKDLSNLQKHRIGINSSITYNDRTISGSLRFPVYYQYIGLDNDSKRYYGLDPALHLNWTLSSRWTLGSNFSVGRQLPREDLLYNGYIQNNYRTRSEGYLNLSTGKQFFGGLNVQYKDIMNLLFANAGLNIGKYADKKISSQYFQDEYIINYYLPHHTRANRLLANGSISKWVDLINGTVALNLNYQINESDIMRNDVILPYNSKSLNLGTRIDIKLGKWSNVTYRASFTNNRLSMDGSSKSDYSQFNESLDMAFHLISTLQLKFSMEHYCNEITDGTFKNFVFADLSASLLLGEKWELLCTARNIFNKKHYSYSIETNQTYIFQEYKLRPFNLLIGAAYQF